MKCECCLPLPGGRHINADNCLHKCRLYTLECRPDNMEVIYKGKCVADYVWICYCYVLTKPARVPQHADVRLWSWRPEFPCSRTSYRKVVTSSDAGGCDVDTRRVHTERGEMSSSVREHYRTWVVLQCVGCTSIRNFYCMFHVLKVNLY
jgi:hypothetical protein